MALLSVEDLTFAYPGSGDSVFQHLSFQVDTDWKLGFLGRNGRGKTTFLRLLQGRYEYSGTIAGVPETAYFPYKVPDMTKLTMEVLSDACPQAEEWELLRETGLLGIDPEALYRPFGTLSNGERTKALLAALFCGEDRYLLIDEPTNHLDAAGRRAAAAYLRKKRGLSAGVPRPGFPGRLRGPHPGPEQDRRGGPERQLLLLVGEQGAAGRL